MKILIFGAGGVGSVVGGFLARTGHSVSLVGRSWHLEAVQKHGLVITGIWGEYRIKAFDLYRHVSEIKNPDFDLIVLAVKSFDTEKAVEQLLPLMKEKTTLLSLQNGLGNIETVLAGGVRPENYLVGRIIFGVELEPGVAKVTVNADDLLIGALPGVFAKMSAFQMARTLQSAKLPARAVPDILTHLWAKLIYNCALNALCSLHRMPYGRILDSEQTRGRMERVVRECYAVGTRKGVTLDPSGPDAFLELLVTKLIPSTAAHFPSMLQDLKRGKRTDIDALNGAIARFGKELGIPTPENELLYRQIQDLEASVSK